ncbi:MAG TPA: ATP-binding protein [Gemmatimonadaceae bacterium]|nr:ATP-binding protein [Gemmatimonadaceae bacterium]
MTLSPHAVLRWVYLGRLSLAIAVFVAAAVVSQRSGAEPRDLLVATLAFGMSVAVVAASFAWSEIYRKPLRQGFLYLQTAYDLLLVTAVVHLTGGGASQFAALYILVIAAAALLLPTGGSLLVAALGNVLYFADVVVFSPDGMTLSVWLQLSVFAVVALGSAWVGARLQEAGRGREAVEAELARYRLQAENILETIRSGIVTVDARGHLRFANPAAASLLELDLTRAMGRPILGQIAARAPHLAAALERAVGQGERTTRAEGVVSTEARRFPVGVTTTFTDHPARSGEPAGRTATAIFSDISDQKRLEQLRLRAERLEGIAALSASLAHEIKNPLAAVRSAVEQLAGMPQVSEDERTLTTLVVRESDRLSRFLSEFLDFTRVRVTQTTLVDAAAVARGAASLAAAHPDCPPGVAIGCSVPEGMSFPVHGDEDLLHRAVFNLVLNAVQAVPANGRIAVDVLAAPRGVVPSGLDFPTGAVLLRVTDDGPGIPPDARDRMFDPFYTTKPGGSGLGLAVVQRAVEAHRGFVTIDSPCFEAEGTLPARGSRVSIVLPRAVPTPATPSASPVVQ